MTAGTQEPQSEARTTGSFISSLVCRRTSCVFTQMIRFGVAGAAATVVDWAILLLLADVFFVKPAIAVAIGFAFGLTVSYIFSIRWVFSSRSIEDVRLEFVVFAAIGIVGLLLTELIIHYGITEYGRDYLRHSKAFATVTVFGWNFGARRILLFRERK